MPVTFEMDRPNEIEEGGNSMDGAAASDAEKTGQENHLVVGAEEQPYFIAVENSAGEVEKVRVVHETSEFETNKGILKYLAKKGDLVPAADGDGKNKATSLRIMENVKRRGSLIPEAIFKKRGGDDASPSLARRGSSGSGLSNEAAHYDLDKSLEARKKSRSETIVTPGLISDLKENRRRIVSKNGHLNIALTSIKEKNKSFFKDYFNTMIDLQWRWVFATFFASFLLSWLAFGYVYYLISAWHGDFEPDNLPSGEAQKNGTHKPCIWAIEDFTSCFLFSVETQHTIG